MTTMDCRQVADAAAELALGVLPGDERAAALAHLDRCASCQQLVMATTGVTDRLLVALAASVEPPPDFERRVLAALGDEATPVSGRRRPRRLALLGAAAACLAAITLALGVPRLSSPSVVAAEMRTSAGAVVGEVRVQEGSPAVLSMKLPGWTARPASYGAGVTYAVRVERTDGPDRLLPVSMNAQSSWATALDIDPGTITSVAVVDDRGTVWCQARLPTG